VGKIRFFFAASLDGYIADPEGGVEFLDAVEDNEDDAPEGDDDGYETFFSDIGTLVMGRGTYKFLEDNETWPYPKMRTIVLTHRAIERPLCDLETRVVDDFASFARELRTLADGDAWIVGGGNVMGEFLSVGEVDRIQMSIVPFAIGRGIPMYSGSQTIAQAFSLAKLTRSASGVVRLTYERR